MNTIYMQIPRRKVGRLTEARIADMLAISITIKSLGIDLISINGNPYSLNEIRKEFSRMGYTSNKVKME